MLVRPLNNWLSLFFSTSQILNTKNENENGIFCKILFLTEVGGKKFQQIIIIIIKFGHIFTSNFKGKHFLYQLFTFG
jgi:hypothetical protein